MNNACMQREPNIRTYELYPYKFKGANIFTNTTY